MSKVKLLLPGIGILLLAGCAMNGLFLYPDALPHDAKEATIFDFSGDRTVYMKLGEAYQPTFFDTTGTEVKLEYEVVSFVFPNRKGDSLHGWFLRPVEKQRNGITLFYLHGNAGNVYSQHGLMLPFVNRGYTVFMFDYSGFGHSEGKARRKTVYTDTEDAFHYLQSQEQFKGDHLVVYGQSLGGHLTAAIGNEVQDEVDAFVMEGAFSSHDEVAADRSGLGGFARMMVRELYAGVDTIPLITKPKMIIHSREDAVVPYYMGEELFHAAREPKSFYVIDQRHILGPLYYADSIDARLKEVLGY